MLAVMCGRFSKSAAETFLQRLMEIACSGRASHVDNRLCATHAELSRVDLSAHAKLLRLGTRLWREGRRDRDVDEDDANDTRRGVTVWTP